MMQYPTSAKVYLSKFYGVPIQTVSRIHDVVLNEQDVRKIIINFMHPPTWQVMYYYFSLSLSPTWQILGLKHLKSRMDEFCSEMSIPPVDPMK